ncbi:hypothetical protein BGW36DRAFT_414987 [Talaromyces proteolyticus]|uniref:NAD(P)-binding protein n=1 Tax=Talaromyces proteolyticus TaxID=1131652 RepID=A0AAD4L1Q4_9EURO|nr:uncharacterized protein BGW36DRAFT_414987 [Talaromyces proteolyticus]KAH8702255.1 hypothetical protein BGW36DRAFT_414987 [Talaromyces proteolyticus]
MGEIPRSASQPNDRDALIFRQIPRMTLSSAENPLNAPLPPDSTLTSPSTRALSRFAVEGNAVITGGAGALGMATARSLLEHGLSSLALLDLSTTLESSAPDIARLRTDFAANSSCEIHTFSVDVTSPILVNETIEKAATVMGGIDILLCLAGIVGCEESTAVTADAFMKVIDVNLKGSFVCAQAVAKHMIERKKGGSIVFTGSISAHLTNFPQPQVAYNASKAAVVHMARNLAVEWAVYGIRVNSVSPGYMDTVLNAGENLKELREIWASNCPMGRMGDVEEITGAFVLLASKRAGRYMTGADIVVDGGAVCL